MPSILDLIQAATAPGVAPVQPPMQDSGPDITVAADPKRSVEEDVRPEPSPRKTDELVKRKGMFGIHGTLRDVLGGLGDAFLIGSGHNAIYRPVREQEKLGSALYGYGQDPAAAADRVALVNPGFAEKLYDDINQGKRLDQQGAALALTGTQKAGQIVGSLAGAAMKNKDHYALIRPQMQAMSDKYNLGYTFPAEYDENYMGQVLTSGMSPDEQIDNTRADTVADDNRTYHQGQLTVAQQRAKDARDAAAARTGVAMRNAGTASQRAAEAARHNRTSEKIAQQNANRRGSGKQSLAEKFGIGNLPPPPPGFKIK